MKKNAFMGMKRFFSVGLVIALIMVIFPTRQVQAAGGTLTWGGPINHGYRYYYYNNSNLPTNFSTVVSWGTKVGDPGGPIDLYYDKSDLSTIYCTELNNNMTDTTSSLDSIQSQTPTPNMVGKESIIRYILARGQQTYRSDLSSIELQIATQIAIWCVAENVTSAAQLDAILYPASATQNDKAHFAPTLEVGRLARKLLEGARANANKPASQTIPSFTSKVEASAVTFDMKSDGNAFKVELNDTNGILGYDWDPYITVKDDAGLNISVTGNTMTITGNPGSAGKTIVLESALYTGSVYYVASGMHPNNDPNAYVQKMVRLVGATQSITPLFLKVRSDSTPISLTISKTFAEPTESQAVIFTITKGNNLVDLSRFVKTVNGTGNFAWITDGTDGKFTLTHDTSVMFDGLTPGTYVVTEDVPNGFEAPDVAVNGGAGSKEVTNGAEIVVNLTDSIGSAAFTNKKVPATPNTPNTPSTPSTPTPTPENPSTPTPTPENPSEPTPTPEKPTPGTPGGNGPGPKTGDASNIVLWVIIMTTSALSLYVVKRICKRSHRI